MAMSEAHRALLRTNRVMLVRDLEVNDALFAVLIAEDLFSESNCQDILVSVAYRQFSLAQHVVEQGIMVSVFL